MSRVSMFNSPLLLGFDQLERTLDRLAKNAEGYPPYNIERIGENGLRIVLAVAGFTTEDLAIELVENQLMVRGKQTDDGDRVFLHRGIAARQFQRAFMLADGIEVMSARLDNGLLSIAATCVLVALFCEGPGLAGMSDDSVSYLTLARAMAGTAGAELLPAMVPKKRSATAM